MTEQPAGDSIVLCVPGPLADRSEFATAMTRDGWIFAGVILLRIAMGEHHVVHLEGHDPRVTAAFEASAGVKPGGPDPAAIAAHRSVAYLVDPGGSRAQAAAVMAAGKALLGAGGLGLKVETTGVAHSAQQWDDLADDGGALALLRAYVVVVRSPDEVYTCGMRSLGFPDVRVAADVPDAGRLADALARYLVLEEPSLREGETFGLTPDEPGFRLERAGSVDVGGDELLTNPLGSWRLVPL